MDKTRAGEKLGAVPIADITKREMEVLCELVRGKTDAEIAEALHLSVATVKQHVQRIREKTKFRNRTELAVQAALKGIGFGKR